MIAAFFLFLTAEAFACACCSEPGTRYAGTERIDSFRLTLLNDIEFGKKAELFTTEAGFDTILGLDPLRKEYESEGWTAESGFFDLTGNFAGRAWRVNLKSVKGKTGSLVLPMPATMRSLKVDIHDGSDRGLGPVLYKELVFEGRVASGTGFFRSGLARPATYTLVFQGRGHGCDEPTDYKNWHVQVYGPKANYAFYGVTKAAPVEKN